MSNSFCDPTDYSLPGYSVQGISQARILKWIVISFSRGPSQPRNRTKPGSLVSPVLAGRFFTTDPPGKPHGSSKEMFMCLGFQLCLALHKVFHILISQVTAFQRQSCKGKYLADLLMVLMFLRFWENTISNSRCIDLHIPAFNKYTCIQILNAFHNIVSP